MVILNLRDEQQRLSRQQQDLFNCERLMLLHHLAALWAFLSTSNRQTTLTNHMYKKKVKEVKLFIDRMQSSDDKKDEFDIIKQLIKKISDKVGRPIQLGYSQKQWLCPLAKKSRKARDYSTEAVITVTPFSIEDPLFQMDELDMEGGVFQLKPQVLDSSNITLLSNIKQDKKHADSYRFELNKRQYSRRVISHASVMEHTNSGEQMSEQEIETVYSEMFFQHLREQCVLNQINFKLYVSELDHDDRKRLTKLPGLDFTINTSERNLPVAKQKILQLAKKYFNGVSINGEKFVVYSKRSERKRKKKVQNSSEKFSLAGQRLMFANRLGNRKGKCKHVARRLTKRGLKQREKVYSRMRKCVGGKSGLQREVDLAELKGGGRFGVTQSRPEKNASVSEDVASQLAEMKKKIRVLSMQREFFSSLIKRKDKIDQRKEAGWVEKRDSNLQKLSSARDAVDQMNSQISLLRKEVERLEKIAEKLVSLQEKAVSELAGEKKKVDALHKERESLSETLMGMKSLMEERQRELESRTQQLNEQGHRSTAKETQLELELGKLRRSVEVDKMAMECRENELQRQQDTIDENQRRYTLLAAEIKVKYSLLQTELEQSNERAIVAEDKFRVLKTEMQLKGGDVDENITEYSRRLEEKEAELRCFQIAAERRLKQTVSQHQTAMKDMSEQAIQQSEVHKAEIDRMAVEKETQIISKLKAQEAQAQKLRDKLQAELSQLQQERKSALEGKARLQTTVDQLKSKPSDDIARTKRQLTIAGNQLEHQKSKMKEALKRYDQQAKVAEEKLKAAIKMENELTGQLKSEQQEAERKAIELTAYYEKQALDINDQFKRSMQEAAREIHMGQNTIEDLSRQVAESNSIGQKSQGDLNQAQERFSQQMRELEDRLKREAQHQASKLIEQLKQQELEKSAILEEAAGLREQLDLLNESIVKKEEVLTKEGCRAQRQDKEIQQLHNREEERANEFRHLFQEHSELNELLVSKEKKVMLMVEHVGELQDNIRQLRKGETVQAAVRVKCQEFQRTCQRLGKELGQAKSTIGHLKRNIVDRDKADRSKTSAFEKLRKDYQGVQQRLHRGSARQKPLEQQLVKEKKERLNAERSLLQLQSQLKRIKALSSQEKQSSERIKREMQEQFLAKKKALEVELGRLRQQLCENSVHHAGSAVVEKKSSAGFGRDQLSVSALIEERTALYEKMKSLKSQVKNVEIERNAQGRTTAMIEQLMRERKELKEEIQRLSLTHSSQTSKSRRPKQKTVFGQQTL